MLLRFDEIILFVILILFIFVGPWLYYKVLKYFLD